MSPTIRVVFIITGTMTGGAQSMLLKVIERLSPQFSPYLISLAKVEEMGERIRAMGVPVESFGMESGKLNLRAFWRMKSRLREIAPNVVHTWMYHADLMGGLAARLAGVPAVAWCIRHGNPGPNVNKQLTLGIVKGCAWLSGSIPDKIVCCSEIARQVHIGLGYKANKMVVIPNGFDLSHFKPDAAARRSVREELGVALEVLLVGFVGRFHVQKNLAGYIEAAAILCRRRTDVHFVLVGCGIDASNRALTEAIAAAGLSSVMHLLGLRHDMPRLMASLDVLASSSLDEAFPNILGEAMACGVPCAVTDVGDSAFIVGDTGRVVASGDMPGLAAAMDQLLDLPSDQRLELCNQARARVAEHFEISSVVKRYEDFYRELGQSGQGRKSTGVRES